MMEQAASPGQQARYTGHVEPANPPAHRILTTRGGQRVDVRKLSVGGMDNNVYILRAMAGSGSGAPSSAPDTIVIDAAAEPDRILGVLTDCRVGAIVTTHRHRDHWQALGHIARRTGAPTSAGRADAEAIAVDIDERLDHESGVRVGPISLEVLHTPGHTPGSICLLLRADTDDGWDNHLFTGDTLFPGGPGNTFGAADAFATIMRSLRERVFALPDSTWVYPGHGDDTTLRAEREHLDAWQRRGW